MTVTMKQSKAIVELSFCLYDFLPGSGAKNWKNHISFKTIAERMGVGHFWSKGSKQPSIAYLLEKTLEEQPKTFEKLLKEVIKNGFHYRKKKDNEITREEMERINGVLIDVGFKFQDLWEPSFLYSLEKNSDERARDNFQRERDLEDKKGAELLEKTALLAGFKDKYTRIMIEENRQKAGYDFEKFLSELFKHNGLVPRTPFRVVGEQIDGSIEMDSEIYLVEAKWTKEKVPQSELYSFRAKIEGKSQFTRGMFVSVNGYQESALEAIVMGKQPNFFAIDGTDIWYSLEGNVSLIDILKKKLRLLTEEGKVYVPFEKLGMY